MSYAKTAYTFLKTSEPSLRMSKRAAATFASMFDSLHERLSTGKQEVGTIEKYQMSIDDLERFLLEELVEQTIAVAIESRCKRIAAKHIHRAITLHNECRRFLVA